MWQTVKQQASEFWHGTPGQRFQRYYRQRQRAEQAQPWKKALSIGLGLVLVVIGLAMGLLPGLPGFMVGVPGLGLLVTHSCTLARWLDRGELVLRRILRRVRGIS